MIKAVVQIAEIGIALTIAVFLGNAILKLLTFGIFTEYNGVFEYFVYLFGYDITVAFTVVLSALFVVMVGRWCMSWASNNGGQSPNNK